MKQHFLFYLADDFLLLFAVIEAVVFLVVGHVEIVLDWLLHPFFAGVFCAADVEVLRLGVHRKSENPSNVIEIVLGYYRDVLG